MTDHTEETAVVPVHEETTVAHPDEGDALPEATALVGPTSSEEWPGPLEELPLYQI
jgi:hypothetical protein